MRCYACGHECPIPEGAAGVCKVRFVRDGVLHVPWGYVGGVQCDPIEKKPFFHAHPGALAYSFGMLGCDLHCSYCQNWVTSQALRDPAAVSCRPTRRRARWSPTPSRLGARVVVSTYNEPLITAEWAVAIFKEARAAGLMTGFVSNGNGTARVLDFIRPVDRSRTRSISRASTTGTTGSSAAGSSRSCSRSAGCTRWASGWRSSRC